MALPDTADPDEPTFKLEYLGRFRAMLGAGLGLYGLKTAPLGMSVGAAAFVELVNLGNESPVP